MRLDAWTHRLALIDQGVVEGKVFALLDQGVVEGSNNFPRRALNACLVARVRAFDEGSIIQVLRAVLRERLFGSEVRDISRALLSFSPPLSPSYLFSPCPVPCFSPVFFPFSVQSSFTLQTHGLA